MARVVANIFVLLFCVNFSIQQLQQLPTIQSESEVEDYIEQIISIFERKLSVETVPEYAREDGDDIINELRDELLDCKQSLLGTHSLVEFRGCVQQQILDAEDQTWEFEQSLVESTATVLSFHVLLIPFILVYGLFF